jgi:16S rRNA (uracil1498-N3)-methyltransferase
MKAPPRLFCATPLQPGASIYLPEAPAHHVARVLRLGEGNALILFDGRGGQWCATISHIDKRGVRVALGQHNAREAESPLQLTLLQGIASADKMDWIIQKAVELGVCAIAPLFTERTVLKLSPERAEKRSMHWRNIIVSACEQCGRNRLPQLFPTETLSARLARAGAGQRLVLSPKAPTPLAALPGKLGAAEILIGPEGGLAERELEEALAAGFTAVSLGPRVLRTETAGLAALAVMQGRWGDWGLHQA